MRLKIVAKPGDNGLVRRQDVKIINAETGEMVELVQSVKWTANIDDTSVAEIVINHVEVEIEDDFDDSNVDKYVMPKRQELEVFESGPVPTRRVYIQEFK